MQKFVALFFVTNLWLGLAHAASTPNWQQMDELIERASGNLAFRELQARFPQYLGELDATYIDYASLFVNSYHYRGATTCAPADSRLTHVHVTRGICESVPGEKPHCYTYFMDFPGEQDPCATP